MDELPDNGIMDRVQLVIAVNERPKLPRVWLHLKGRENLTTQQKKTLAKLQEYVASKKQLAFEVEEKCKDDLKLIESEIDLFLETLRQYELMDLHDWWNNSTFERNSKQYRGVDDLVDDVCDICYELECLYDRTFNKLNKDNTLQLYCHIFPFHTPEEMVEVREYHEKHDYLIN